MWEAIKLEGCNPLPDYCWIVRFNDGTWEGDPMSVRAGEGPLGMLEHDARNLAALLNKYIDDTEAELCLNTYTTKSKEGMN